jgi:hypothetical protein
MLEDLASLWEQMEYVRVDGGQEREEKGWMIKCIGPC